MSASIHTQMNMSQLQGSALDTSSSSPYALYSLVSGNQLHLAAALTWNIHDCYDCIIPFKLLSKLMAGTDALFDAGRSPVIQRQEVRMKASSRMRLITRMRKTIM